MVGQWYLFIKNQDSRFIKNREAKGLLSNLGVRTPLSKVPILGDILFWMCMLNCIKCILLAGNKFMAEMHLKQPGLWAIY